MGSRRAFETPVLAALLQRLDLDRAVAVIVFGSVARGDQDAQSDLDVLVVVDDDEARASLLAASDGGDSASPLVVTRRALLGGLSLRPSFVAHLLDEGVTVHETPAWADVRAALVPSAADGEALAREVRRRAKELEPLSRAERFANSPVTVMAHLYGVARALVIARLLQAGVHEYSWRHAFDRYAELRPDLRSDIEALAALRPYYECARGRPGTPTLQAVDTEDVRRLVGSAERLAA